VSTLALYRVLRDLLRAERPLSATSR
jgi:hypothetical protein